MISIRTILCGHGYNHVSRGVARVENREGQIIFKFAQSREGALKRGAECTKRGAICLKRGAKCLKGALDA